MIKVNTKQDQRISEAFPNDPYSNLCILTTTQKLNLQQAFLSMDSEYFSKIDPDTREIDLRELKQQPLIRVIHSLYGQQLILNSISQLAQVYPIILYLGIEDYKRNIMEEVEGRREIIESLQFLEFSYKYKFQFQRVLEVHMQNKLKLLEDSKNYLQLNKIENETFNCVLMEFWTRYGEAECKIINNVLEYYFNRNNIKPLAYLKNPPMSKLLSVWLKYHHVSASEMVTLKSTPLIPIEEETRSRKRTEQLHRKPLEEDNQTKRRKVEQLEKEIEFKDCMIRELQAQIQQLKKDLDIRDCAEITAKSMLITSNTPDIVAPMKKKKRLAEMSPEVQSDEDQNEKNEPNHEKPRKSSMQIRDMKVFMQRFGSKNIKKI